MISAVMKTMVDGGVTWIILPVRPLTEASVPVLSAITKLKAMDMLARREGFYDKQSLEFPEFPDPDVKREAYLEAISQKERPALAISSLLCPMDRERVRKALEKRLEEEKHSKPTKAAESALEESGNGEDEQDDFDLIKIMKDVLGEKHIKRIVQEKMESLLSSWQ